MRSRTIAVAFQKRETQGLPAADTTGVDGFKEGCSAGLAGIVGVGRGVCEWGGGRQVSRIRAKTVRRMLVIFFNGLLLTNKFVNVLIGQNARC